MWQYLLRNWAYGKAREHVQKAAMDAVRERAGEQHDEEDSRDRDLRCDVLLVASSSSELGSLASELQGEVGIKGEGFRAIYGVTHGRRVVVTYARKFQRSRQDVVRTLIEAHRPRWVIACGFVSGLSERLRRGQMFIAQRILSDDGERVLLDMKMEEADGKPAIRIGSLLSTTRDYHRQSQKKQLAEQSETDAVELYAYEIAKACQAERTPLLAVHVISDTAGDDLPQDIRAFLEQESTAGKLGAATGALMNRLSSVKDLWQLKEDSLLASESLGKFLGQMLEQLPPAEHEPPDEAENGD